MDLIILVLMAALIVLLLGIYFRLSSSKTSEEARIRLEELPGTGKHSPCPLCGSLLLPGERVHSVVYPGKGDRLVEIYGCPYCYPPNRAHRRYCPSCKRELEGDELVFARLFESSGKVHVHVNGCRICMHRRT
jgi:RNase P subunit RPR2